LFRIGLASRVLETEKPFALDDARTVLSGDQGEPTESLGIAGFLGIRVAGSSGEPLAVVVATRLLERRAA